MGGETDLRKLLASMRPRLMPGTYVFATIPQGAPLPDGIEPVMLFREAEAVTLILPQEQVDLLMKDAENGANSTVTVDLETQEITRPDGQKIRFDLDPFRKHCLINGLDDIGLTMQQAGEIDSFEAKRKAAQPWLAA